MSRYLSNNSNKNKGYLNLDTTPMLYATGSNEEIARRIAESNLEKYRSLTDPRQKAQALALYNYHLAIYNEQVAAAKRAEEEANKKKKDNIFKQIANSVVDVAKITVQGVLAPVTALNGGKSVLSDAWDPKTAVFKALDSGIDKLDSLGHKVGQTWVKGVTGGAVDLSKGGIFQKDGIEKTIDLEKLAMKAASTAVNSEAGQKVLGDVAEKEIFQDAVQVVGTVQEKASEAVGSMGNEYNNRGAGAALESITNNNYSSDMGAMDFLNSASNNVLGGKSVGQLATGLGDSLKSKAIGTVSDKFNSMVSLKKNPFIKADSNAVVYPNVYSGQSLGGGTIVKKAAKKLQYIYPLGWR